MLRPAIVITAAIVALASTGARAEIKSHRPDDILVCIAAPDTEVDDDPGSLIFSCCYADGCWICDNHWSNCVWDAAYRKGQAGRITSINPAQTLAPVNRGAPQSNPTGRRVPGRILQPAQ